MAVNYRELSHQILTSIFVKAQVFLCGTPYKHIGLDQFLIFVSKGNFVVISNAGISCTLLMFVFLAILSFLVVNTLVQFKTVDISSRACCHNMAIIMGYYKILN